MSDHEQSCKTTFIAFGNNVNGNLDPTCSSIIQEPTDITSKVSCRRVFWTSWTCSIGQEPWLLWGNNSSSQKVKPTSLHLVGSIKRVIGFDHPQAFLLDNGFVRNLEGVKSSTTWDDAVLTATGTVYGCKGETAGLNGTNSDARPQGIPLSISRRPVP
ncbi:uncharacterized protein IL334_007088 [Kwoniella shivajii]|uniref:Uncharacterized protein n=1 Tax=Kwoniella shivajii TaxID=564305 RepID=A0ABZ1D9J1_9TREE|nr:hypothetical protein IL334_007088 [Kwoniella shivajii]